MTTIYPYLYLATLSAMVVWQGIKGIKNLNTLVGMLFFACLIGYGFSVGLSTTTTEQKLWVAARDLLMLSGISWLFGSISNNKLTFGIAAILLFGGIKFIYWDDLQRSLNPQSQSISNLDKDAELLLDIKEGTEIAVLKAIQEEYNLSIERSFPKMLHSDWTDLDDYFIVNIPAENMDKITAIKAAFRTISVVEDVEENESVTAYQIPQTQILNDPNMNEVWGFGAMDVDNWLVFQQKQNIQPQKKALIAILDTGVDAKHEDISANYHSINKNYDMDNNSHGTHCAGIAGAVSNNKKGIASLSTDNRFVEVGSVQVLGSGGGGSEQTIVRGIIEAADAGAQVISMSLGGRATESRQKAYEKAIAYANKAGAIVVVAAGNSNDDAIRYVPASIAGVITVSAVNNLLQKADFSNTITSLKMGIAAPGVDIFSTLPNNKYGKMSGTSMATPYVAGLIGVMKSLNPSLTTNEVYQILKETGKETQNTAATGKLIQTTEALKAAANSK